MNDVVYQPRLIDRHLAELLAAFPAVLVNGPRAAGKTTSAYQHAATVVRLDQPAQAAAFHADPDAALFGRDEPVLLDEWQEVPEVLGAVKRAVDDDGRPGRFILTGSVRSDLEQEMWPGTGRLIRVNMFGLTEREIEAALGSAPTPRFIDALMTARADAFGTPTRPVDLRGYINRALRGGFPGLVLDRTATLPDVWIDSYLDQLLTRDSHALTAERDQYKLARYFEAVAANSAGIVEHKTIYDAAGIDRRTADAYDELLGRLYIAEQVPAWSSRHLDRLIKMPKRYIVDGSLMAAALDATPDTILNDGDLLGRTIDTFVMTQLRPELAITGRRARLHHLRTKAGREEVDIVIEMPGGKLLGLEITASAAPRPSDAHHLRWLRDRFPDRFIAGAVLHTGPDIIELDHRILALPISTFWA